MMSSTPTSLSRYRPAILVFTGAAAAYVAWLLYTSSSSSSSIQAAPPPDLHRSNALRRVNRRTRNRSHTAEIARSIQRLQQESVPLGDVEFFGNQIALDARHVITGEELREMAREYEPSASPEMVEHRVTQLYDTFYDRLLNYAFPDRALSLMEADAITRLVTEQQQHWENTPQNPRAFARAMLRHTNRFALADTEALLTADGAESIAPTDLSWPHDENTEAGTDPDGHTLQRTLYHIAEERARHEGVIHRGITCNGCDTKPIRGIRWRCANCPDFDLCSECEATNSHHKTHIFYKIRVPAPYFSVPKQEPVYPGRPYAMSPSVNTPLKKRLVERTRMEAEEIEALWDQFTCLAATEWPEDPDQVGWALDRRAFNHAFIPRYSSFASVPNLVYDRIFAYFDTNQDNLIGFEEFIKGLDGLHSNDTGVKLRIAFNGYDVDGDGYVSRKDLLRIFRAHYAIEREATRNHLAESAEELSVRGALETIHSAHPLGAAFTQGPTSDRGYPRPEQHKGEIAEPVLNDVPDTMDREAVIGEAYLRELAHEPHDSDHVQNKALRRRWARRQYYTDEEEGLAKPPGAEDGPYPDELEGDTDGEVEEASTPEYDRRRGSRSSSRVRFQDDVDMETRSNASTSSRPIGERWGGYEIPEPEKDLGKEVLYQITQQAFNELLDPLFKEKEETAMDTFATRAERRLFAAQIESLRDEFEAENALNRAIISLDAIPYALAVIEDICATDLYQLFQRERPVVRDDLVAEIKKHFASAEQYILEDKERREGPGSGADDAQLWNAKLCRTQILLELTDAIVALYKDRLRVDPSPALEIDDKEEDFRDPTLPQFRPDSVTVAPSSGSSQTSQILSGESETTDPIEHSFGPLFVAVGEDLKHAEQHRISSSISPKHRSTTPQSPPPPPFDRESSSSSSTHIIAHLFIDPATSRIEMTLAPLPGTYYDDPLKSPQAMRTEAMYNHHSPLHLPFLASLETVDREISERKGSGMLNFEEFCQGVETGRLRFLESWMDFVSF